MNKNTKIPEIIFDADMANLKFTIKDYTDLKYNTTNIEVTINVSNMLLLVYSFSGFGDYHKEIDKMIKELFINVRNIKDIIFISNRKMLNTLLKRAFRRAGFNNISSDMIQYSENVNFINN